MEKFFAFCFSVVIFSLGIFYFESLWLTILFCIIGGLAMIGTIFKDESDPYKEKVDNKIMIECQTCGEYVNSSDFFNANNNPNGKLFLADTHRVKEDGDDIGLNIYPLLCFECEHVTEYATDFMNVSGRAKNGYEYFGSFRINRDYQEKFLKHANSINNDLMVEKIENIKL
tara:strand:- start:624 stop:1136 length:513 start_codon:yes stop_codon:yes gene_type:complete